MKKWSRNILLSLIFLSYLTLLQVLFVSHVEADIRVISYPKFQELELDVNSTLKLNVVAVFTSSARTSVQFMTKYKGNWSYLGHSALLNNLNITGQIKIKRINNTIIMYNKELTPPTGRFSLTLELKPMEPGDYNLTWAYTFVTLSSLSSNRVPVPKIVRNKGLISVHVTGREISNKSTHISEEYSKVAVEETRKNVPVTLKAKEVSGKASSKSIIISNLEAPSKVRKSGFYVIRVSVTNLSTEKRNMFIAVMNEYTGELIVSCQIPTEPDETVNVAFGLKAPSTKGTIVLKVVSGYEGVEEDYRRLIIEIV